MRWRRRIQRRIPLLRPSLEGARELVEVVVVVPGDERQEPVDRDPAADRVDAALLPLGARELAEGVPRR
jgi:hypothetical protein